jgi:glutamyl-tRNA synthetase
MNPNGNKKLSKRDGAKDILDYKKEGYLPDALVNFLATLGWNDGTKQEIFSRKELIEKFELSRVHHGGAHFDEKRLLWLNGHYLRETPLDELFKLAENFWPREASGAADGYKKDILALEQERLKFLAELSELTGFFFAAPTDNQYKEVFANPPDKQLKKLTNQEFKKYLEPVLESLKSSDFSEDDIANRLNHLLKKLDSKPSTLFPIIRLGVTASAVTPQLFGTLNVLGKEESLKRLKNALNSLEM